MAWIEALGAAVRRTLEYAGDLAHLSARTAGGMLRLDAVRAQAALPALKAQLRFTGEQAIWLVAGAGAILGAVTLLQAYAQLASFGPGQYTGTLLAAVVLRELGPVLAAVLVIGRSGTAIAAELATMRLGEEVDALVIHGVDPAQYLLAPRLIGAILSIFGLMIFLDAGSLAAGFAVAHLKLGMPWSLFWAQIRAAIEVRDFGITALKAVAFGALIALQACYFGLSAKASQTEIPQVVTKAVVASLVTIFIVDGLFVALIYG
ncbi:MAG: ABC transporter permease [Acidobacteria bacterium]|nr:ABC transporter permease [Acidobacteriota bacterium]